MRKNKLLGVGAGFGIVNTPLYGGRLEVFYNLNSKFQLISGLSLGRADETLSTFAYNAKSTSHYWGINSGIVYFPGNSFSFGADIGIRSITTKMAITESSFVINQDKNYEVIIEKNYTNITLNLDVANMWSFNSGFYIRPVWFGVVSPITKSTSRNQSGDEAKNNSQQEYFDDFEYQLTDEKYGSLSFYIMLMSGLQF